MTQKSLLAYEPDSCRPTRSEISSVATASGNRLVMGMLCVVIHRIGPAHSSPPRSESRIGGVGARLPLSSRHADLDAAAGRARRDRWASVFSWTVTGTGLGTMTGTNRPRQFHRT